MYALIITAILLFVSSLAQAAEDFDSRINPTPSQIEIMRRGANVIDEPTGPESCTWADTGNGFRITCGPAHVDPADCNDGFVKVCVRRYGNRTCDCYPDDSDQEEPNE